MIQSARPTALKKGFLQSWTYLFIFPVLSVSCVGMFPRFDRMNIVISLASSVNEIWENKGTKKGKNDYDLCVLQTNTQFLLKYINAVSVQLSNTEMGRFTSTGGLFHFWAPMTNVRNSLTSAVLRVEIFIDGVERVLLFAAMLSGS